MNLLCMQSIICIHEIERVRARNANACASVLSDSDPSKKKTSIYSAPPILVQNMPFLVQIHNI